MTILLIIAGILLLFFLVAAIMTKKLVLERSVTINRSAEQVFSYIKYLKNHDNFSTWNRMDPEMKKEYRGTDGQIGFVYTWDSSKKKNVGAGEQEIKRIDEVGREIEFELRFTRPMPDTAKAMMRVEAISATQAKVTWGFYNSMKYPMNVMMPMVSKMLTRDLENGLATLKVVLEKP